MKSIYWISALVYLVAGSLTTVQASEHVSFPTDLDTFRHINTLVVPAADSPIQGIHHFYMNRKGLDTFNKDASGNTYPPGTKILGKVYKPIETANGRIKEGQLAAFTYMVKDPESPATKDTGGWHFLKYDAKGKPVEINPVQDCFGCHRPHEASDFVMSEPLQ